VIAKELAEAGLSVIVIEAGRRYSPLADYLTDRNDFETSARDVFRATDARRDVYTTTGAGFAYSRVKGVGGSTLHYVGMSPRLHQSDFATRTTDGVGEDWPIRAGGPGAVLHARRVRARDLGPRRREPLRAAA